MVRFYPTKKGLCPCSEGKSSPLAIRNLCQVETSKTYNNIHIPHPVKAQIDIARKAWNMLGCYCKISASRLMSVADEGTPKDIRQEVQNSFDNS